jgi:hypothetical protein
VMKGVKQEVANVEESHWILDKLSKKRRLAESPATIGKRQIDIFEFFTSKIMQNSVFFALLWIFHLPNCAENLYIRTQV